MTTVNFVSRNTEAARTKHTQCIKHNHLHHTGTSCKCVVVNDVIYAWGGSVVAATEVVSKKVLWTIESAELYRDDNCMCVSKDGTLLAVAYSLKTMIHILSAADGSTRYEFHLDLQGCIRMAFRNDNTLYVANQHDLYCMQTSRCLYRQIATNGISYYCIKWMLYDDDNDTLYVSDLSKQAMRYVEPEAGSDMGKFQDTRKTIKHITCDFLKIAPHLYAGFDFNMHVKLFDTKKVDVCDLEVFPAPAKYIKHHKTRLLAKMTARKEDVNMYSFGGCSVLVEHCVSLGYMQRGFVSSCRRYLVLEVVGEVYVLHIPEGVPEIMCYGERELVSEMQASRGKQDFALYTDGTMWPNSDADHEDNWPAVAFEYPDPVRLDTCLAAIQLGSRATDKTLSASSLLGRYAFYLFQVYRIAHGVLGLRVPCEIMEIIGAYMN